MTSPDDGKVLAYEPDLRGHDGTAVDADEVVVDVTTPRQSKLRMLLAAACGYALVLYWIIDAALWHGPLFGRWDETVKELFIVISYPIGLAWLVLSWLNENQLLRVHCGGFDLISTSPLCRRSELNVRWPEVGDAIVVRGARLATLRVPYWLEIELFNPGERTAIPLKLMADFTPAKIEQVADLIDRFGRIFADSQAAGRYDPTPMDPFLQAAIDEAQQGLSEGGLPIGSVLVRAGQIIGRGHNRRVQHGDPMAHAEIDCLKNAGRQATYKDTVLYSTLMPCYLCTGAAVQFGVPKVVVGESVTFPGGESKWGRSADFLRASGIEVIDLHDDTCIAMMTKFIKDNPTLWNEDIGV